jgi:DNA-binding transcriptional ArsR family regulator
MALTEPAQVKALSHPLRNTILGLLHERAATVSELASALERPKSTVAHRTARMFYVAVERSPVGEELPRDFNDFEVAAQESAAAFRDGKLWGFIRHARISEGQASEFWERMAALVTEFDQLPRSGETMYGFAVGVYPTDQPTLPNDS